MSDFGPPQGPPPPQPAAEQPMAEIPFTEDELGNLTNTSRAMLFAGMTTIVTALVKILCGLAQGFLSQQPTGATIGTLCGNVIAAGVAVLLGGLLIVGSRALGRVVTTDEADQEYLVGAIKKLRTVFVVKVIWICLLLLLMCVLFFVVGGLMAAGGMR